MRRKNGMDRKHRAGLYLRLSKEDEAQGQSGSISNQRAILERYAQDQGWEVAGCYIDDGYSGLHFVEVRCNLFCRGRYLTSF